MAAIVPSFREDSATYSGRALPAAFRGEIEACSAPPAADFSPQNRSRQAASAGDFYALQGAKRLTCAGKVDPAVFEVFEDPQDLLDVGFEDFTDVRLNQFP